ncbi:MAG: aspartate kinase [Deltaproteobacteria bacterium]|nr:aspartate kinase [Deltaproteobacteria bacterium]
MEIIVQKYGGSSLTDVDRLQGVAERVAAAWREGRGVVVVVSAMGNTTSELLGLAHEITADPDRRELDMLLSVGERVSMALLAMALKARGVPARSLTGSQSGIITDESHADAGVVEVRPTRVRACLDAGEVVIVAGFQGVSREREVTTLGRGGSDTTAVVLAAALGAAWCEIYSDVDGVWSADPRVVPEAIRLDQLSLAEALALARGGAKVLFEDAVRYARDHRVNILAATSVGPGSGSRIVADAPSRDGVAVTGARLRVARLTDRVSEADLRALQAAGFRVRRRVGDRLLLDDRNAHGGWPAVEGLHEVGETGVVVAVGSELGASVATLHRADRALAGISLGDQGAAGDEAWWEVPARSVDEAVRRVHLALVR